MRILLIGQCTLHWGRMEFGNIGNYYVTEPFIRGLHRVFPGAEIRTTLQMSETFCQREKVTVLPMEYYYGWNQNDLERAKAELASATVFNKTGHASEMTPFMQEVLNADMVIDDSEDLWGDPADSIGPERFLVGLCKDRVAQLLCKKTVLLAASPGPFAESRNIAFAREVFENFNLVTTREPESKKLLRECGFNVSKVKDLACPSYLFEQSRGREIDNLIEREKLIDGAIPTVGFLLCGNNFLRGPYDRWPRADDEYTPFVNMIEFIEKKLGARVRLLSHSNGFCVPPSPFELIRGRDFPILEQLLRIVKKRDCQKTFLLKGVYTPWETHAIIGKFDMLISGRLHGAVAGLTQFVPTVLLNYGNGPAAHKHKGFARVAGIEEYVTHPADFRHSIDTITKCWTKRKDLRQRLHQVIPHVQELARKNFELLKEGIDRSHE